MKKSLINEGEISLSDLGLRYDLTLPLARYYANNRAKLSLPFKVIQMDKVYRAEQPQRGRLREFTQCDIDIIGLDSEAAEIELISVTAKALLNVGISNFKIKLNDRRILRDILINIGFAETELDSACITFDKRDKIGTEGVIAELSSKGFQQDTVDAFARFISQKQINLSALRNYCKEDTLIKRLETIIDKTMRLAQGQYVVEFDMSLVRGQGYYTGTVFEIESSEFGGSIGGGGRYDNLIRKFINEEIPAVGFSIGFERIFSIMIERGISTPDKKDKVAIIYAEQDIAEALLAAEKLQGSYDTTIYIRPNKVQKLCNRLRTKGFTKIYELNENKELKLL